jgi:hypothetical protein
VRGKETTPVLPMAGDSDLALWQRLDDVIMGGQSSSSLELVNAAASGDADAVNAAVKFGGELVIEGGGFCGARTKVNCCFLWAWLCW